MYPSAGGRYKARAVVSNTIPCCICLNCKLSVLPADHMRRVCPPSSPQAPCLSSQQPTGAVSVLPAAHRCRVCPPSSPQAPYLSSQQPTGTVSVLPAAHRCRVCPPSRPQVPCRSSRQPTGAVSVLPAAHRRRVCPPACGISFSLAGHCSLPAGVAQVTAEWRSRGRRWCAVAT